MKIRYSVLKSLMSSACLISIGGQSSVSHAMDFNLILKSIEDNYYCLSGISEESIKYMQEKGYTIQKSLGSGHSGVVFLAEDKNKHRRALKFTYPQRGNQIYLRDYNVQMIDELPSKYRQLFTNMRNPWSSPTGDLLLYEALKKNGIVDLGANACKIYGLERTGDNNICVILEYIEGTNLCNYIQEKEYKPSQVKSWLKDICKSLKTMYKNNFLHLSIGASNIIIREHDDSAALIDYERVNRKDLIEVLMTICQKKYDEYLESKKANNGCYFLVDEEDYKFAVNEPRDRVYYDLYCLRTLIDDIVLEKGNKYNKNTDLTLHNKILELKEAETLEEFLKKVDKL